MKRGFIFLITLFFFVGFYPAVFSQLPSEIEEEIRKEEEKFLNELKKQNPQMYEEEIRRRQKEKEKREIIESYHQGKISYEIAKNRLLPFIKEEIDTEGFLSRVDEQIQMLKEEIERLQRIKKNPSLLIEERLKAYLGR